MSHRFIPGPFKPLPDRGQNFLIDQGIIRRILDSAALKTNDVVVEIGAGYGALTIPLVRMVSHVVAIEWDKRLVGFLEGALSGYPDKIRIIQADIMRLNLAELLGNLSRPPVILGNLPYYCATPFIQRVLYSGDDVDRMIFMIQKELAERITALPGTKAYGYLTLFVKYFGDAKCLFEVPPQAFKPSPKVKSCIIHIVPRRKTAAEVKDEKLLFRVIKAAFKYRRKKLINSLKIDPFFNTMNVEELCELIGLTKNVRAECLTLNNFVQLTNAILSRRQLEGDSESL